MLPRPEALRLRRCGRIQDPPPRSPGRHLRRAGRTFPATFRVADFTIGGPRSLQDPLASMRGPGGSAERAFSPALEAEQPQVLWPHCPDFRIPATFRPQSRDGMGSGEDQARPWAARDRTPGCGGPRSSPPPSAPSAQARAAGPSAPFKLGRGGTRAQGQGSAGTTHKGGLDAQEPHGPVRPRNADHRPARFSSAHRAYPNLPPTASPSWRRANGAPCARKPQKWGRLPRATPEQKGTARVSPELHAQPTQEYKDSKNLPWVTEVNFPRIIPIQIRRGRLIPRREVPNSTSVVQCILGLVVSF